MKSTAVTRAVFVSRITLLALALVACLICVRAHTGETKPAVAVDTKVDTKVDPKVNPKVNPKVDRKVDPKVGGGKQPDRVAPWETIMMSRYTSAAFLVDGNRMEASVPVGTQLALTNNLEMSLSISVRNQYEFNFSLDPVNDKMFRVLRVQTNNGVKDGSFGDEKVVETKLFELISNTKLITIDPYNHSVQFLTDKYGTVMMSSPLVRFHDEDPKV